MSGIYRYNGYVLVNEFTSNRNGFNHITKFYSPTDGLISEHKCHYINRTWEPFTYYTSMLCAIEDAKSKLEALVTNRVKSEANAKRLSKELKTKIADELNVNQEYQDYCAVEKYIRSL